MQSDVVIERARAPMDEWTAHSIEAQRALDAMLDRVFAELEPKADMSVMEWAEEFRVLSREESNDYPGDYDMENTPALRGIMSLLGRRGIRRMVGQKSAQIGWTAGVLCSAMGYFAHWRPCVQVVMFPRIQSAKDFDAEKFTPMVRATPALYKRIRLKSRADGNSATRKHFPGGLIKLVASNSPSDVKSTSAAFLAVEEPDDTNRDVKGQGRSMALLRERGKTIRNSFMLIGGTPTAKGASEVEAEMRTTDQRRLLVECHHCGERHDLSWDYVTIPGANLTEEDLQAPEIAERYPEREVYGRARWEDAFYTCPHCGGVWTDDERIENIRRVCRVAPDYGWEPTAESPDPGFFFNELQSVFDGSRVPVLAEKFLRAQHLLDQGDPSEMIAFWNSSRGLPWEYRGELPEEEELRARAEKYAEWSCPAGGLVPLMTVDVQHNRLAVTVWVVGRGDEMWLAYWGELYGATIVAHQGAWVELEQTLARRVRHASGAQLRIAGVAIDCSDGQTSDAAYAFVRKHNMPGRPVRALKGAPDDEGRVEIWTPPRAIDPNHRGTKASKYGVQVNIVGTAKGKDLVLGWSQEAGRVRLTGNGPGRMHWYEGVRADFFEQLLSEIKIPSKTNPRRRVWKHRTDRNNEALDCTVYAVWLSRDMRLHVKRAWEWDVVEMRVKQADMLSDTDSTPAAAPAATQREPVHTFTPEDEDVATAEAVEVEQAPAAEEDPQLALLKLIHQRRRASSGR
jgi:phage terminase large subunit GpA-like protein